MAAHATLDQCLWHARPWDCRDHVGMITCCPVITWGDFLLSCNHVGDFLPFCFFTGSFLCLKLFPDQNGNAYRQWALPDGLG